MDDPTSDRTTIPFRAALDAVPDEPAGPLRRRRVVASVAGLVVSLAALATSSTGITGSHPAYLLMVVLVLLVSMTIGGVWGREVWFERRRRRTKRTPRSTSRTLLAAALTFAMAVLVWWLRPVGASDSAIDALVDDAAVDVTDSRTTLVFEPVGQAATTGVVFFPGALVDPRAYAPTLRPLAEAGVLVVVPKPPFGLALLAARTPTSVIADHPEVTTWVVGGHSLGGTVASAFARDNDEVDGLLLWAAYPAGDMSDRAGLEVLSVSAEFDGLATPADIDASVADLPAGSQFVEVPGAVHAFFGDYGDQRRDGSPTTSRATAQAAIVDATIEFLESLDASTR